MAGWIDGWMDGRTDGLMTLVIMVLVGLFHLKNIGRWSLVVFDTIFSMFSQFLVLPRNNINASIDAPLSWALLTLCMQGNFAYVWIHIASLFWVQTVCKGYPQKTLAGKELVIIK